MQGSDGECSVRVLFHAVMNGPCTFGILFKGHSILLYGLQPMITYEIKYILFKNVSIL